MAKLKKAQKQKEMDMLPVMSLMTILIPVLLTMIAFQRLAIVEINMPERSDVPQDFEPPPPDENALNLTVTLSKEGYVAIWGRAGHLPSIWFKEMWTFRCKSDGDTITYAPSDLYDKDGNVKEAPKCRDGTVLDAEKFKFSIETIDLWALYRESEEDPGTVLMGVYNRNDSVYLNTENQFISDISEIRPNAMVATLSESSLRRLACGGQSRAGVEDICSSDGKLAVVSRPLSAYDVLARELMNVRQRFIDSPDADNITIVTDDDTAFDKIISVMDRARDAGFPKIQLAVLEAGGG